MKWSEGRNSYELKEDVILPCGKILYKAGIKVNPLDYMGFDRELIFIDGRDKEQIDWLKHYLVNNRKRK